MNAATLPGRPGSTTQELASLGSEGRKPAICFLRSVYHQLWMSYEADDSLGFCFSGDYHLTAILLLNYLIK